MTFTQASPAAEPHHEGRPRQRLHEEGELGRDGVGERHGQRGVGQHVPSEPEQHRCHEPRERSEGIFDVGVGPAAARDAASYLGEAEEDERHRGRAHQVGQNGGGPQLRRDHPRQHENAAADREVDHVDAQREGPNGPHQAVLACARRVLDHGVRRQSAPVQLRNSCSSA